MTTDLVFTGFLNAADRHPAKLAFACGAEQITFGDLAAGATQVAAHADRHAARRVALQMGNSAAFAEAFYGAQMGGAVAVVFDPLWPTPIRDAMQNQLAPDLILTGETLDTGRDGMPLEWAGQSQPNDTMPFLIGFTSGSTGLPKPFVRSHASWIESFATAQIDLGTTGEDTICAPGPLSHGLSLFAMADALNVGASFVTQNRFDPSSVWTELQTHGVTTLVAAPALLDLICRGSEIATANTVTKIITAGDRLLSGTRDLITSRFPEAEIISYYGASELSFVSVAADREQPPVESAGRATAGVEIEIRDDDGTLLAPGKSGRVWVKSRMLANGYVGAEANAFEKDADGWATVGDLGYLDETGWLFLTGRPGDMIISGGYNIAPADVERVLSDALPEAKIAVVGLPDAHWGQRVTAVKESSEDWSETHQAMAQAAVEAALPRYMKPRDWRALVAFPLTSSGKVDRPALIRLLTETASSGL